MAHLPLIPMGSITGKPTRDELRRVLDRYHASGLDQFMIYPRSGLELAYMGPAWIDACGHILERAAELGMAVWLYDEYNWPSGRCKGAVVRACTDHAAKKLVAFADTGWTGGALSPLGDEPVFWSEIAIPTFTDLLDPEAVDAFISMTHEVYYRNFAAHFGPTIKGIFSDEPSFMYARFHPVRDAVLEIPWYRGADEDYARMTGRRLRSDLDRHLAGDPPPTLWQDYYRLLGDRFNTTFLARVRRWCEAHAVLFTGHLMEEAPPEQAILANGRPLEAIRQFSLPGMDEIHSATADGRIEWNAFKLLEGGLVGRPPGALAELFALGPADLSLEKVRFMIHLAALHGVDRYVMAVSAMDARANIEKPFYFNPMSPAQPWFRHCGVLNAAAAASAALAGKPSTASIALRYPQRLCSAHVHDPRPAAYRIGYGALVQALIEAQREFRVIGDEETPAVPYQVVLVLDEAGAKDERSGIRFPDIPAILAFLDQRVQRRALVADEHGAPATGILLKTFDDGTLSLLNVSGSARSGLNCAGERFDLPPLGVATFPRQAETPAETLDLSGCTFACSLSGANTRRCLFTSGGESVLEVADDVVVSVVTRRFGGGPRLTLDGTPVIADRPCSALAEEFACLYDESAPFTLTRGRHALTLANQVKDHPYLPLAFVAGSFALGADQVLRRLPTRATIAGFFSGLTQYAGEAVFHGTIDLHRQSRLTVGWRHLATEVRIDGIPLGARLWRPFAWDIPAASRRTGAAVEIRIATSIGPLFADYPALHGDDLPTLCKAYWPGQAGP